MSRLLTGLLAITALSSTAVTPASATAAGTKGKANRTKVGDIAIGMTRDADD